MIRKLSAVAAAFAFALTTLAPVSEAYAQRRHHNGYSSRYHDRGYDHGRRWRHHDDDGDAVAAGVVGLVLGLAIGSMASQANEPRYYCRDNYQRCAAPPPPPCRNPCGYDRDSAYDPRYDDRRYDDGQSAYERDYGYAGNYDPRLDDRDRREQCVRRERQWDRYANRYVTVDVPC